MRILISPAKQMIPDPDTLAPVSQPRFLPEARLLLETLRQKSDRELQSLWKTNDALTAENIQRVRTMDLTRNLTPALFCYHGIQYQYLGPSALEDAPLAWLSEHLRIGSGFHGLLRPLDGIVPYRLEMQARLRVEDSRDLYAFWGDRLARALAEETDTVLDLASREYSRAILDPLPASVRVIRCVFLSRKPDGTLGGKSHPLQDGPGTDGTVPGRGGTGGPGQPSGPLTAYTGNMRPISRNQTGWSTWKSPPAPVHASPLNGNPPLRGAVPWRSPELRGYALVFHPRTALGEKMNSEK